MDKFGVLESAVSPLPAAMRQSILRLPQTIREAIEEIRLRIGKPLAVTIGRTEREVTDLNGKPIVAAASDVALVMDIVTRSSIHSAVDSMRHGFITMQGGHRIGICATAVMKDGTVSMLRSISSLCIRVAREVPGCSNGVMSELMSDGTFCDTLVMSPPGLGKTTFIRDVVRNLSDRGIRVGIADERGEIAAVQDGRARFAIVSKTDILDGAPKNIGMLMLLKTMSPAVICVDEITAPEDVDAVEVCANCGVRLLATVHASSVEELYNRPVSRMLMERGVFRRAVIIGLENGSRTYRVKELAT